MHDSTLTPAAPTARSRRSFMTGALIGGAVGVLGTTVFHTVGHLVLDHSDHVDIGFCTDMTVHHIQAIGMCERVLGRDTGDPVQAAATEVIRNQAIEVGMMRAWLADWGASTAPPTTVMAWMSMDDMTAGEHEGIPLADMPGYATDAELSALSTAESGVPMGRMWLQLMRAHHVGGVAMAEAAAAMASSEKVVQLAQTQADVQTWEIDLYDELLRTTYA